MFPRLVFRGYPIQASRFVSACLVWCLGNFMPPAAWAMGWIGDQRTTIKGRVKDAQTSQAIADASVQIATSAGQVVTSTITDASGAYTVRKRLSGHYQLTASASRYQLLTVWRDAKPKKTYIVDFSLKRLPNKPPTITSLSPARRSIFAIGDTITLTLQASDPDQDTLRFRFSLDGQVIQDWTALPTTALKTTSQHQGRHTIKAEVQDPHGASDSRTTEISIVRPFPKPVE